MQVQTQARRDCSGDPFPVQRALAIPVVHPPFHHAFHREPVLKRIRCDDDVVLDVKNPAVDGVVRTMIHRSVDVAVGAVFKEGQATPIGRRILQAPGAQDGLGEGCAGALSSTTSGERAEHHQAQSPRYRTPHTGTDAGTGYSSSGLHLSSSISVRQTQTKNATLSSAKRGENLGAGTGFEPVTSGL